jgi:hypothetical protein
MTETQTRATRNEAAERLRNQLWHPYEQEQANLLDEALAAERAAGRVEATVGMLDAQQQVADAARRATVERIRERIYGPPTVEGARQFYARVREVLRDEEAAR